MNKSKISEFNEQGKEEGSVPEGIIEENGQDSQPLNEEDEIDSMESYDPAAEYEKQKKEEEERLKLEMEEKLKAEITGIYNKNKDHIIPNANAKNLPQELPKDLIYWHRCETNVIN